MATGWRRTCGRECGQIFLVLLMTFSGRGVLAKNGMVSRSFPGVPSLQILECSGIVLETNVDLLTLTIFTSHNGRDVSLVSVNLRNKACSIAEDTFSLCNIDNSDSRKASLQTLISNPTTDQPKVYGCNATVYLSGGRVHTTSWSLPVYKIHLLQ